MPFKTALTSLALVATCSLSSADTAYDRIDAYLKNLVAKGAVPSISVAVVRSGHVSHAAAYGFAEVENEVLASPNTVYRLGSITKQFTATMIMQLVSEGKLNLDQPILEILSDCPPTWSSVTTRHLLNHTSGIKSYTEIPGIFADAAMKPISPAGIIKTIDKSPLDFEPGTKWHYDNTGYELLGMIIEKLDRTSYANSLSKRILTPLGMTHTYFTSEQTIVKHRAQGYSPQIGGLRHAPYLNMSWPYAAGSMESTVLDLAKWDAALYGSQVLSQDLLKQMWTRTVLKDGKRQDYGFGWQLATTNGIQCVEHGGGIHGFTTYIKRAPSKKLSVIVLINSDSADSNKIANDIIGIADSSLLVAVAKPIANDDSITKIAQAAITSLLEGHIDRASLTREFAKKVTPELEAGVKNDLGKLGKITKLAMTSTQTENRTTTRNYRITLGTTPLSMVIVITKEGLIAGLKLSP